MLPFLRSDLAKLVSYTPHPGGADHSMPSAEENVPIDALDTNESPNDLPDHLKQKLGWLFQQDLQSNRYPDGKHEPLKAAIAAYVNESAGLTDSITASQISVGNGSDELIRSLLIATCLGGSGSILVAQPTFSMYAITATTLGIPVVSVGRSPIHFEIDLEAAQVALNQPQTPPIRVLFVVHPNSPTGNALTEAELEWLRTIPTQTLVVIDEAYFEFSQSTVVGELQQRPNWVILRTFSKAFRLAAHRVGYAIAHPELAATLEKIRLPYNLPSFSQAAALLALDQRRSLLSSIPVIREEREQLRQAIAAIPTLQVWTSAANFIFIRFKTPECDLESAPDFSSELTLTAVFDALKAQGTLIRKISGGLRITIGSPAENQRTLARLKTALAKL
jgi:histidinol-phosphate aminotransferase